MAALARWCVRHRLIAVLLWLCAFGGTTAAASVAGTSYSNDYSVPGTESGRAAQLLRTGFPGLGGDSDTVVWHTAGGTVRAAHVERSMTTALDRIARLPGIASVDGPYDGQGGPQISADGRTAYATVTFARQAEDIGRNEAQAVVGAAKAAEGDGLQVELGGSAIGLTETPDDRTAEVVGVLVAAVVLFLAFGSLAASLLPIATALIGVGTAHAGIGLLGHAMTVADFAPMLGMLVGLGVGIDYALFIVTRHRRGLKRGLDVTEAAVSAVTTTGRAVVFAGATVCIALLGMLILRLSFLNGVAVAAGLTVILTVAASVTLLPALLSYLGPRALGRRERRRLAERGPRPEVPTGLAARWSALVERRPKLLGSLAVAVIALLALPTLSLNLGTSDQGNDPRTSTTRKAYDLLADGFGHGVNGPLTLVARVDGAADRLARLRHPGRLRHRRRDRLPDRRPRLRAPVPAHQRPGGPAARGGAAPRRAGHLPRHPGRRGDRQLRRLRRRDSRQTPPVRRHRHRARLPAAARRLPLARHPAQGRRDEHRRRGRRVRRGRRHLPVGLGQRTARPRPRGPHRTLPARDHGLGALRTLHGLPGLPGQPDVRGVAGDRRQPARRPRGPRRDQPGDQLRRRDHDLGLPGLRAQRRPCDRHVRHRARRRRRPRRLRAAHPPGARPDASARRRQLVAARLAGAQAAAHQHRAAGVPRRA